MIKRITSLDTKTCSQILDIENSCFDRAIAWDINMLKSEFNNTFSYLFAYTNTDTILAYTVVRKMIDSIEIGSIAVKPSCQGKGIATQLLDYLVEFARQHAIASIHLEVCVNNIAAINLYTKFGFEIVATRKNFYCTSQWGSKDAFAMQYTVK